MTIILLKKTHAGKTYLCTACKHMYVRKRFTDCPECTEALNHDYAKRHPLKERKKWTN